MFKFGEKKEDEYFDTDDRLIVWDQQNHTCEIYQVTEVKDDSVVCAGRFVAPKELCNVATSREGRIFMYQAPAAFIQHAEKLAKIEKGVVLEQITRYKPIVNEDSKFDIKFIVVAALLFVAIIAAAF